LGMTSPAPDRLHGINRPWQALMKRAAVLRPRQTEMDAISIAFVGVRP
jgi:hypothetical protein